MDGISSQIMDLLDNVFEYFPRLCFLSEREVIQLLSFCPTPFKLQTFVHKCFEGVQWLEVDVEMPCVTRDVKTNEVISQMQRQMRVLGVFGSLQEYITFSSPLKPDPSALVWLCFFEKQLKSTMMQLTKQCSIIHNQLEPSTQDSVCDEKSVHCVINSKTFTLPLLDLLPEYPLQCVLVAEEAVWCQVLLQAFQESNPVKLSQIKAYSSEKLKGLCDTIRDGLTGAKSQTLVSKYMMICLSALVQRTMNHTQQLSQLMEIQVEPVESSFEWLRLMKYYINSNDWSLKSNDDAACYVDVLGYQLKYDFEYYGPEHWMMVHTASTDRAKLGIILALTSHRCGFVKGPWMSGKKKTIINLGKALGRQVVSMQCCSSVRAVVVQRMLLGALQTGAWLLLDSVDLLSQAALSLLGQHLLDIHQSFSKLRNKSQKVFSGCKTFADSECHMTIAGKNIPASLSYGCVVISSKGYMSEIPESLQCATRPIALTHPDYRVIAEAMLTSIGFSDAVSLSQHLLFLLSQFKDSLYLPDFIMDKQSCYLIGMQKIISAAGIYLQQTVKEQTLLDDAKIWVEKQNGLNFAQNVTSGTVEENKKDCIKTLERYASHFSVVQVIMEETAIVKAIVSVWLPVINGHKRASQFYAIVKETFPIACQLPHFQQYIEEEGKNQLKEAIIEELQRKKFHADPEIICSALTLYQTIKFGQAVMLIGPSGSGKSTCYSALAQSLNHLTAKAVKYDFENDSMIEVTQQISSSAWTFVDTLVLFPNAMSNDEVFGYFCEKRGWQDGAVPKVLRDLERNKQTGPAIYTQKMNQTPIMKWLVFDGNPAGQPSWLDYLTTLCSYENPYLCLSSGETLQSQSHLKLLMEITDLHDASPSAVTRCSLVHFTGTDLWMAVWKSEMGTLSFEHKLDQGTLKMWSSLAGDLFSDTLSLVRQKALTSAVHNGKKSFKNITYGLQEILSFVRILHSLLQNFRKEMKTSEKVLQTGKIFVTFTHIQTCLFIILYLFPTDVCETDKAGTRSHDKQELLARNLFLVAYIWGFSGHLHPR